MGRFVGQWGEGRGTRGGAPRLGGSLVVVIALLGMGSTVGEGRGVPAGMGWSWRAPMNGNPGETASQMCLPTSSISP